MKQIIILGIVLLLLSGCTPKTDNIGYTSYDFKKSIVDVELPIDSDKEAISYVLKESLFKEELEGRKWDVRVKYVTPENKAERLLSKESPETAKKYIAIAEQAGEYWAVLFNSDPTWKHCSIYFRKNGTLISPNLVYSGEDIPIYVYDSTGNKTEVKYHCVDGVNSK